MKDYRLEFRKVRSFWRPKKAGTKMRHITLGEEAHKGQIAVVMIGPIEHGRRPRRRYHYIFFNNQFYVCAMNDEFRMAIDGACGTYEVWIVDKKDRVHVEDLRYWLGVLMNDYANSL